MNPYVEGKKGYLVTKKRGREKGKERKEGRKEKERNDKEIKINGETRRVLR